MIVSEIRNNEEKIEQLGLDIESQGKRTLEIQSSIDESKARVDRLEEEIKEQNTLLGSNSNVISGGRMKLGNRQSAFASLTAEAASLESERLNLENRISILSDMDKEFEGCFNG